jgi:hypothetical protein
MATTRSPFYGSKRSYSGVRDPRSGFNRFTYSDARGFSGAERKLFSHNRGKYIATSNTIRGKNFKLLQARGNVGSVKYHYRIGQGTKIGGLPRVSNRRAAYGALAIGTVATGGTVAYRRRRSKRLGAQRSGQRLTARQVQQRRNAARRPRRRGRRR